MEIHSNSPKLYYGFNLKVLDQKLNSEFRPTACPCELPRETIYKTLMIIGIIHHNRLDDKLG